MSPKLRTTIKTGWIFSLCFTLIPLSFFHQKNNSEFGFMVNIHLIFMQFLTIYVIFIEFNEIDTILYEVFCTCFFSLNIMFLRFMHFVLTSAYSSTI